MTTTSPFAGSGDARTTYNPGRRYVEVEGVLADMPEVVVNQDKSRTQMAFKLQDVRCKTADGVEQFRDEHTVFLPYSSQRRNNGGGNWVPNVVDENDNINPPLANELYYEVFLPEFKEAGIDFDSGESITAAIGQKLLFEEKTVERHFWNRREGERGNVRTDSRKKIDETGRQVKFEDTNQGIFLADDDTELIRDRDAGVWTLLDGTPTDKEPPKVPETYTGLVLTRVS